jgi:hypothetical protein
MVFIFFCLAVWVIVEIEIEQLGAGPFVPQGKLKSGAYRKSKAPELKSGRYKIKDRTLKIKWCGTRNSTLA